MHTHLAVTVRAGAELTDVKTGARLRLAEPIETAVIAVTATTCFAYDSRIYAVSAEYVTIDGIWSGAFARAAAERHAAGMDRIGLKTARYPAPQGEPLQAPTCPACGAALDPSVRHTCGGTLAELEALQHEHMAGQVRVRARANAVAERIAEGRAAGVEPTICKSCKAECPAGATMCWCCRNWTDGMIRGMTNDSD